MFQTHITRLDRILFVELALVTLLSFFSPLLFRKSGSELLITTPETSFTCPLDKNETYTLSGNGYTLTLTVMNGEAYVEESNCPDGICYSMGKISTAGESILCAPAGIRVTVKGGTGDVDFVAG